MLCLVEMFRSTLVVGASGLMLLLPLALRTTKLQIHIRGTKPMLILDVNGKWTVLLVYFDPVFFT